MTANTRKQRKMTTALIGILLSFVMFGLGFVFVCSEDNAGAKRALASQESARPPGSSSAALPERGK